MLEERRSEVLRALVEEHIRTGEPVSSRSILQHSAISVSTATIRHDLAALERDGFVVQPHTSAGRVPTSRAYRYYVDHLGRGRLTSTSQARIVGFFSTVQLELSNLLKATSQLLAEVAHNPAVVVRPSIGGEHV
ncbi:MAG: heat-inducible transcriptional repressor HrcA, partial [Acidimicrobiia bacterium]